MKASLLLAVGIILLVVVPALVFVTSALNAAGKVIA
jgi:hypothetical protein